MHPYSRVRWSFLIGATGILAAGALLSAQSTATATPADLAYGASVFADQCASCHATHGDGVAGAELSSGQFRNAGSDQELRRLLTNGFKTMPGLKLDGGELFAVVAYIRNMKAATASGMKLGDRGRGESIVSGRAACFNCHMIRDVGSRMAPDLSDIGSRRNAGYLQRHLVSPDLQMFPINRPVRIVTRDGKVINGRRLNESSFSVQLADHEGRLVSLLKSDLREFTILSKSPMPSFQDRLTSDEMADVLSYLLSLKGQ